jgi:hypothetical protein
MTKKELCIVTNALECLKGEKFRCIHRAANMGTLGFGKDVERLTKRKNKDNVWVPTVDKVSKYALHIQSRFRFTCKDEIIVGTNDMYYPSSKIFTKPDFDWTKWYDGEYGERDAIGNESFDEICEQYFNNELTDYIVKTIKANKFGDLKIEFENGFKLEVFVDTCGDDECWRFFDMESEDDHLVVTGQGLLIRDDEEDA